MGVMKMQQFRVPGDGWASSRAKVRVMRVSGGIPVSAMLMGSADGMKSNCTSSCHTRSKTGFRPSCLIFVSVFSLVVVLLFDGEWPETYRASKRDLHH